VKFSNALQKNRYFYLISLLSLALFIMLQLFDPPLIREHIESKSYDLRLHLRNLVRKPPSAEQIVLVMIDEQSIAEIGRWPWSRDVQARLVDKIAEGRPKVLGIDIMYSERENEETDGKLAQAIKRAGNVVLSTSFLTDEVGQHEEEPAPAPDFLWDAAFMEVRTVPGIDWKKWALKPEKVLPPLEELAKGAFLGHVTNIPDLDGVLRWDFMYVSYGDDCYPSFPLQVARVAAGVTMKEMSLYGGSKIRLGDRFIATDLSGRVLVNYLGREKSFPHTSAADLLKGRVSPDIFRGRMVLLGTSARGTFDQKVTPFSANYPGVEKNANVVNNILKNNFISKSPGVFELVAIILTSIILIVFLPRLKATPGVLLAFGLMGGYFLISCHLLISHNVWLNLIAPSANMTVIFAAGTITRLFSEEKQAREIRAMFSSYVSPKIVEALINNPKMAALGGERRTVSILFSDIIGFTTLSEKMPPEEVVSMLNEYYKEMAEIIFYWDGTLDKFVGDEIMAIWGAPMDQPDHAERALRCAFHMSDKLERLQEKWRAEGTHNIDCGIGINSGEVVIGNIGIQGKKMDYTAIGSHVNLAARVEKLNRKYGSRILITGNTYEAIRPLLERKAIGHGDFRELEPVQVRGMEEEARIFLVKSLKSDGEPLMVKSLSGYGER
jgi:adenylate cyclase